MGFSSRIQAVDLHACGEPGRVIVGGVPDVPGRTMFEKQKHLEKHMDGLRCRMLREPRGYPASNCNLLLPPTDPRADMGFVVMEQVEYPPMSGSNTICVVTAMIETGIVLFQQGTKHLRLETPGGLIDVEAEVVQGKVTSVTFQNVPCFAVHLDAVIEVPRIGKVVVDVAYGGMFYVIAEAESVGLTLCPSEAHDIVRIGEQIKIAAREQLSATHPDNPEISGISIAQLSAPSENPSVDRKNAVIVSIGNRPTGKHSSAAGVIDRSPCGTGTCAKMSVLHAKGQLPLHQDFIHEGVLGTTFRGRLLWETRVGSYHAVVPTITGQAWITGFAEYVVDEDDPFPDGYILGDLWGNTS